MSRKTPLPRVDLPPPSTGPAYLLPRRWLVAALALLVVPWLVAAALYLGARDGGGQAIGGHTTLAGPPASVQLGAPGRWGQFETTRITISPPLEYVPDDPFPPVVRTEWFFPGTARTDLEAFLREAGVAAPDVARLLDRARPEARIQGLLVEAEHEVVERLSPAARTAVYAQLALSPLNGRYRDAVRFHGTAEEWLAPARIDPATRERVLPLLYQQGGFTLFADVDIVRSRISDPAELRRLAKALHRESTLAVRVRVPDPAQVDEVAHYWGLGGRRMDVWPLLESVAAQGPEASVDVAHLLPPFARLNLYRYPQVSGSDLEKGSLPNCFWTALNFFAARADDRFLDLAVVRQVLGRDYYLVHDGFQLGDVVVFSAADGTEYHAAVHVADGLVFGKNGNASLAPWTILPTDRIRAYYPQLHEGGLVTYYRRKGL